MMAFEDMQKVGGMENLSPSEKIVLWQLAWHRNGRSNQCNPSMNTLVNKTGLCRNTIHRVVLNLEEKNLISKTSGKGKIGKRNEYALHLLPMSTGVTSNSVTSNHNTFDVTFDENVTSESSSQDVEKTEFEKSARFSNKEYNKEESSVKLIGQKHLDSESHSESKSKSKSKSESKFDLPDRLIPVSYLCPKSPDQNPEAEKLVGMFLDYQGNAAYNCKSTLRLWHSAFCRLLKQYPHLAAIMKFGFETDPFWKEKLVRDHAPLEYFEEKLESSISAKYTQLVKKSKRLKAATQKSKVSAPPSEEEPEVLGKDEFLNLLRGNLIQAVKYKSAHLPQLQQTDWWFEREVQNEIKERIK